MFARRGLEAPQRCSSRACLSVTCHQAGTLGDGAQELAEYVVIADQVARHARERAWRTCSRRRIGVPITATPSSSSAARASVANFDPSITWVSRTAVAGAR